MCGPIGDGPETVADTKENLKLDVRAAKIELKQAKVDAKADAKYHARVIRNEVRHLVKLQKQLAKLK